MAIIELTTNPSENYPGDKTVRSKADSACARQVREQLGTQHTPLRTKTFVPSRVEWQALHRHAAQCIAIKDFAFNGDIKDIG